MKPVPAEGSGDLEIKKLFHEGSQDVDGVVTVGREQVKERGD